MKILIMKKVSPQKRTLKRLRGRPRQEKRLIDHGTPEMQARRCRVLREFSRGSPLPAKIVNRALCGSWLHLFLARQEITLQQFRAGLDYLYLSYHVHRLKGISLNLSSSLQMSLRQTSFSKDDGNWGDITVETTWSELMHRLKKSTGEGGTIQTLLTELVHTQANLDTLQFRWSPSAVQNALEYLIHCLKELGGVRND